MQDRRRRPSVLPMPESRRFRMDAFWARGAVLTALILFAGCAKQAPPPGGPPDVRPPAVAWTIPAADSVGVGLGTTLQIGFSEAMDRRSVERALFISPQPREEPRVRWRGRKLRNVPHIVTVQVTDGVTAEVTVFAPPRTPHWKLVKLGAVRLELMDR